MEDEGGTPQDSPLIKEETTEDSPQEMVKKSHEEIVEEMVRNTSNQQTILKI